MQCRSFGMTFKWNPTTNAQLHVDMTLHQVNMDGWLVGQNCIFPYWHSSGKLVARECKFIIYDFCNLDINHWNYYYTIKCQHQIASRLLVWPVCEQWCCPKKTIIGHISPSSQLLICSCSRSWHSDKIEKKKLGERILGYTLDIWHSRFIAPIWGIVQSTLDSPVNIG